MSTPKVLGEDSVGSRAVGEMGIIKEPYKEMQNYNSDKCCKQEVLGAIKNLEWGSWPRRASEAMVLECKRLKKS